VTKRALLCPQQGTGTQENSGINIVFPTISAVFRFFNRNFFLNVFHSAANSRIFLTVLKFFKPKLNKTEKKTAYTYDLSVNPPAST
jgi:hypothetical protein